MARTVIGPARATLTSLTVMITDLEDSTWLWDHHPDVMEDVIAAHGRLVHQLVGSEGRVVKSTGDGVLAAFDDAASAVRVAVEVQRETERASWPEIGRVAVRIGLNTGSCRLMSDDVLGPAPNLAARLQSAGHGGQILLATSTAAACGDRLDADIRLRNLGPHLVRSFDEPVVIHMVCAPDLRDGFPPLRVALDRHADLPADEGELIGRPELLREVELLVRTERLVTLWGPAGVGKSRVAIRLATTTRRPFDAGVRYVDLAGIRDGDAVVDAMVAAGGAPTLTDEAPSETVRRTLGVKRVLLVLDHCEHLLAPVSSFVADLLATCPATHVLTTSREPLGLRSERPLEVPPLPVPSATWTTLDELRACPSVELFIAGATASRPGFELSADTAPAIVAACRAADGLPLALELASARVGIEGAEVDPVAIVERLVDGPLASSLTRTLSVLEAPAAAAFTRVSTFEGSFDRDQVRAIASGRSALDFDRLVRTAVVQKDPAHAGRYRMLGPFRQIGRNRVPRDEREPLSLQHAQLMLDRAIEHDRTSRGPAESQAVAAFAAEFPDHRLAIETWLRCDRIALAARHANALFQFCLFQPRSEGHAWVRRIAALAGPNDPWAAETIGTAAVAAWYAGDTRQAITLGHRSVAWSQDPTSSRWALIALVDAYSFSGDVEAAVPHFVALTRSARDDEPFGRCMGWASRRSGWRSSAGWTMRCHAPAVRLRRRSNWGTPIASSGPFTPWPASSARLIPPAPSRPSMPACAAPLSSGAASTSASTSLSGWRCGGGWATTSSLSVVPSTFSACSPSPETAPSCRRRSERSDCFWWPLVASKRPRSRSPLGRGSRRCPWGRREPTTGAPCWSRSTTSWGRGGRASGCKDRRSRRSSCSTSVVRSSARFTPSSSRRNTSRRARPGKRSAPRHRGRTHRPPAVRNRLDRRFPDLRESSWLWRATAVNTTREQGSARPTCVGAQKVRSRRTAKGAPVENPWATRVS